MQTNHSIRNRKLTHSRQQDNLPKQLANYFPRDNKTTPRSKCVLRLNSYVGAMYYTFVPFLFTFVKFLNVGNEISMECVPIRFFLLVEV